ncbi:MAG: DUF4388 domain-containing protein, partial [Deltaproteobacteria bacterium]
MPCTLIMLCYLGRDPDREIATRARKNLIPAARTWHTRPDRPELPEPIHEIVMKVIEKVGPGKEDEISSEQEECVEGHIGLLGLGEIIQSVDHNNRTVCITLRRDGNAATVFTENGRVVGAVCDEEDGLDALYRAFGWGDALFSYVHQEPGAFKNRIQVSTLNLVMDALERAPDEDPYESDASLNWKVTGHLEIMNVFEIAEIFEMNAKQAVCRLIRSEEEDGILYFNGGRITNASWGSLTGMEAACHLLAWPSAEFLITRGGEGVSEVIHIGMQNLIIEAMRLLDEGVTVTDRIASELELVNELFEGQDVVSLPVLDRVRLVFSENLEARDILEEDLNPVVRKAVKVKISKTVHRYLQAATDFATRMNAARGRVPLSTTEKLVLLSYLSHDESEQIKQQAQSTLASLDVPTYRKGLASDLHPAVMDFLVRETIRDESLIKIVCSSPNIMPETALHILKAWRSGDVLRTMVENTKLLERSAAVSAELARLAGDNPRILSRIDSFEESLLEGYGQVKVEGPLSFCGLAGLMRAAENGARSGTIMLLGQQQQGRVFFRKGKIVGAVWGELEGMPALEAILNSSSVRFLYILRTHFRIDNVEPHLAEELLETPAAGPVFDEQDESGMRIITGHPDAMDIFEVLSALEGTPIPVRVSFMCEEGSGEIYRDHSRVLHVHVEGKKSPYRAMAAILSWSETRFLVRYAREEIPISVDRKLTDFFRESLKEVPDEMKQVTRPGELPEWELSEVEYRSLYHQILEMGMAQKIKL